MPPKIVLVGEQNPYGADPQFALYPAPEGCSGERLCCVIFQMYRKDYLKAFERLNLCDGPWSAKKAREKAAALSKSLWVEYEARFVLLGAKVAIAWQTPFAPFAATSDGTCLILPHPSGRNVMWNDLRNHVKARNALRHFAPWLRDKIGKYKLRS